MLYYTVRAKHARVFRGRHLLLGGAAALEPVAEAKPPEAFAGDLSGILALNLPRWVEQHRYEPGAEVAPMTDWPAKIEAMYDPQRHGYSGGSRLKATAAH